MKIKVRMELLISDVVDKAIEDTIDEVEVNNWRYNVAIPYLKPRGGFIKFYINDELQLVK
jgi:hypothetical protein